MDWSKFFSMGGYGLYVWGSYISSVVVLGAEIVLLMRRQKSLRKRMKQDRPNEVGTTAR